MTFGRIAFSPSSYNPRIPAPQRVAELGRQQHSSHGRCLPRSPLQPLSLRCPHALRDAPTPSALRGRAPLASVARPPPPDWARSPPEPPTTADRGRTHFAGDFLQALRCCPRVGIPEEISAWKSHPSFFGSTPSPRKEGFKPELSSLKRTERRG